jgi:hypothetical protein
MSKSRETIPLNAAFKLLKTFTKMLMTEFLTCTKPFIITGAFFDKILKKKLILLYST